jgi:ATP-dependent DNA helicase RecQ
MYDITDLTNGKYSIIFTNPESLILNKNWRTMLQSSIYQENLFGIVADEAHVVPKW